MRLGCYPASVTDRLAGRRAIWVHAVSVGEVQAAGPLLQLLAQAYPQDPLVLSSITPGGFELASRQLDGRVIPVYFPLDLRCSVDRALETLRPRILLLMESELWPTVIRLTKARGVPVAVVNGRLSARAFARYHWVRPVVGAMLNRVDLFLMQSQADANRLLELGVRPERVQVAGNLKWDASLKVRPEPEAIRGLAGRLRLTGQTVLVAGSTHRGEEGVILDAYRLLRGAQQDLRLILAPRHLERLEEVEALVRRAGWKPVRLSSGSPGGWDVGLVDTFGQLPLYYGLATLVFVGGSLIPHGGQNPLEATGLGKLGMER